MPWNWHEPVEGGGVSFHGDRNITAFLLTAQEEGLLLQRSDKSVSGYKGVYKDGRSFVAQFWQGGKCTHLGSFSSAVDCKLLRLKI